MDDPVQFEEPMASTLSRAAAWFATIGVDEADDDELRLHKTLLVATSLMVGLAAAVWGVAYLALGQPVAASIPLGYTVLSAGRAPVVRAILATWRCR